MWPAEYDCALPIFLGSPHVPLTLQEPTYNHLLSACRVPGCGDPGMSEQGTLPSRNQPFPPVGGD